MELLKRDGGVGSKLISMGKKFLYIFLAVCLCSCQLPNRRGYPLEASDILRVNLQLLPLWLLIGFAIYLGRKYSAKKWVQVIFAASTIYWTLIVLVVIGFFSNFDYIMQSGCFSHDEPFISNHKLFFSLGSVILLSLGYGISLKWQTTSILVFEFLFWLFRGMQYNGAFEHLLIGYFFILCMVLRIVLIVKLHKGWSRTCLP
jgi:hypothetical protein